MKEPKILPDGTDIHNIRKLSSMLLNQFVYWHQENDDLKRIAQDELDLRFLVTRDYVKNTVHYRVEKIKPRIHNTEFSDSWEPDDEMDF